MRTQWNQTLLLLKLRKQKKGKRFYQESVSLMLDFQASTVSLNIFSALVTMGTIVAKSVDHVLVVIMVHAQQVIISIWGIGRMIWIMLVGGTIFAWNITVKWSTAKQEEGDVILHLLNQQVLFITRIMNAPGIIYSAWKIGMWQMHGLSTKQCGRCQRSDPNYPILWVYMFYLKDLLKWVRISFAWGFHAAGVEVHRCRHLYYNAEGVYLPSYILLTATCIEFLPIYLLLNWTRGTGMGHIFSPEFSVYICSHSLVFHHHSTRLNLCNRQIAFNRERGT